MNKRIEKKHIAQWQKPFHEIFFFYGRNCKRKEALLRAWNLKMYSWKKYARSK